MKCENIEELRECRIGVTPDCMLYHSYRLQHINPENYTRRAYIGEISLRQRIRQLQKHCDELQEKRLPLAALVKRQRNFWNWKQCHFRQRIYQPDPGCKGDKGKRNP